MKAIVRTRYGSPEVLELKEVEKPIPKDDELLVQIHAASVNALDWHLMRGEPFLARLGGNGLRKPKFQRLGVDLAGQVEAVGRNVTQFRPGDEVFGRGSGAFAEYGCARESAVVLKPTTLSFEAAASVPVASLIALQALRDLGGIQPGQQVLIQGATGGVGSFAVQLAKAFEADVTAVCSAQNRDLVRSLGADHIVDYTQEDFTKSGLRYDLILGVNGYHPIFAYRRALRPSGRYVMVGASTAHLIPALLQVMLLGPVISRMGRRKMRLLMARSLPQADLLLVSELLAEGKLIPAIEKRYSLAETAEAVRYLEQGHASAKLVITMSES